MSYEKKIVNKRANVESEVDMREVVVIDNGTDTIKIGMSGVDYPQIVIDMVAGIVEPNS
jgi:actin-related protein